MMSALTLIPEERKRFLPSSKSTESLYSSSSSKYSMSGLHRRKAANRQAGYIPAANEVRQRVVSARLLRMKTLQNQLADSQQHIAELANENRILRTLHKRQDSALSKYENTNAELPQLLHSHAEEIRIWHAKYRNLQSQNRELANKIKQKDAMLLALNDQNKHLTQLSRDRNLEERERLTNRVRYLEERLSEKDHDMKLLARRLQLETKRLRVQLSDEHQRYKEVTHKLLKARQEFTKFTRAQFEADEHRSRSCIIPRSLSGSKSTKSFSDQLREANPNCSVSTPFLAGEQTVQNKCSKSPDSIGSKSPKPGKEISNRKEHLKHRKCSADRNGNCEGELESSSNEDVKIIEKKMSELAANDDNLEEYSEFEDHDEDDPNDSSRKNQDEALDIGNGDTCNNSPKIFKASTKRVTCNDLNRYAPDDADQAGDCEKLEIHQEFANIRRQMTEDYKKKESYLETFCQQSTCDADDGALDASADSSRSKELSVDERKRASIDQKKKVKLLAALKAIDRSNSQDSNN